MKLRQTNLIALAYQLRRHFGTPPPPGRPPLSIDTEDFEGKLWWQIEPRTYAAYDGSYGFMALDQQVYYFAGLLCHTLLALAQEQTELTKKQVRYMYYPLSRFDKGFDLRFTFDNYEDKAGRLLVAQCLIAMNPFRTRYWFAEPPEWRRLMKVCQGWIDDAWEGVELVTMQQEP